MNSNVEFMFMGIKNILLRFIILLNLSTKWTTQYCLLSYLQEIGMSIFIIHYLLFWNIKQRTNIEVIVNDNKYRWNAFWLWINKFQPDFKYYKIEGWYSQVGNFENAAWFVSGKYLTMIGDDDSVSNNFVLNVIYGWRMMIDALNCWFATITDIESMYYLKN
jgi:hypothetical protein